MCYLIYLYTIIEKFSILRYSMMKYERHDNIGCNGCRYAYIVSDGSAIALCVAAIH
jgi:hypothetical protein